MIFKWLVVTESRRATCLSVVTFSQAFKDYHYAEQQMTSNTFCHVFYVLYVWNLSPLMYHYLILFYRGTFYQGYLCSKCGAGAHKECLGRLDNCGRANSGGKSFLLLEYHF